MWHAECTFITRRNVDCPSPQLLRPLSFKTVLYSCIFSHLLLRTKSLLPWTSTVQPVMLPMLYSSYHFSSLPITSSEKECQPCSSFELTWTYTVVVFLSTVFCVFSISTLLVQIMPFIPAVSCGSASVVLSLIKFVDDGDENRDRSVCSVVREFYSRPWQ